MTLDRPDNQPSSDADRWAKTKDAYGQNFGKDLLAQYTLYTASVDRIFEREGAANRFWLAANTALVTIFGLAAGRDVSLASAAALWRWLVPIAGLLVCVTWIAAMRDYRRVRTAKFSVLIELEERLPVQLYKSEWYKLISSSPLRKTTFTGLSFINFETEVRTFIKSENVVPAAFILIYLALLGTRLVGA